jgi:hypothetical protein
MSGSLVAEGLTLCAGSQIKRGLQGGVVEEGSQIRPGLGVSAPESQ